MPRGYKLQEVFGLWRWDLGFDRSNLFLTAAQARAAAWLDWRFKQDRLRRAQDFAALITAEAAR